MASASRKPPPARNYFISQLFELRKEMLAPSTEWMPQIQCAELQRHGRAVNAEAAT